jgi:cell division protease FtsH
MTRNEMREEIVALLGGRVAEQLEFNDISTGASNDLKRASAIAHDMIAKYGMSERIGSVSYDNGDEIFVGRNYGRTRSCSERTASDIDQEMKAVLDAAYAQCEEILRTNYDKLREVAEYLLANEYMSRKQFEACMNSEPIPERESFLDTPKKD